MVCASEDSASQSKILKDALVGELKQILVEITQQQINAALGSQQQLGHQLVQSIETGVRQPLTEIAAGFRNHQQQTGEDISAALRDVLAAFMQRTQDLFGDQVTGINDLQQRTIDALQSAVTHLNQMSVNVDAAGRNATDGMSSRLTEAMNAMEARQQVMNERMAEFVEQIRNLVRESQSETGAKLQGLLADIGQQVGKLVSELHSQVRATSEAHEERQLAFSKTTATTVSGLSTDIQASLGAIQSQFSSMVNSLEQQATRSEGRNDERQSRLAEHAEQTIGNFSSKVAKTVAETSEQNAALLVRLSGLVEAHQTVTADAVRAMQGAVDGISGVTSSAISRMNQGAETMFMAADEFGKSGKSISGVLVEATIIAKELSSSAAAVSSSTRVLEIAVSDYKTVREALSQMVKVLGDLVASAGREASLTADVLARIEMSAQKLAAAQNQADRYLDSVSEILTETHQDFADNMRKTLGEGHKQFFENLSSATSLLREGIQELESVLSGIGEARRVGK